MNKNRRHRLIYIADAIKNKGARLKSEIAESVPMSITIILLADDE